MARQGRSWARIDGIGGWIQRSQRCVTEVGPSPVSERPRWQPTGRGQTGIVSTMALSIGSAGRSQWRTASGVYHMP
jgi:hypothetical protein